MYDHFLIKLLKRPLSKVETPLAYFYYFMYCLLFIIKVITLS